MTNRETSRLQQPAANRNRVAAVLGGNADQLLTPPSTNAKSSPESPPAGSSEITASPADVRLTVSPKRREGSPLQKGTSLSALLDIAKSEESNTSSTAGLLQAGGAASSSRTDDRCLISPAALNFEVCCTRAAAGHARCLDKQFQLVGCVPSRSRACLGNMHAGMKEAV